MQAKEIDLKKLKFSHSFKEPTVGIKTYTFHIYYYLEQISCSVAKLAVYVLQDWQ